MDISTREYLQIVHVTFSYILIFFTETIQMSFLAAKGP